MSTDFLMHVGVGHDANPPGRGSGRYPYGTGENPDQHLENKTLAEQKSILLRQGLPETEVAIRLGYSSTTELREAIKKDKELRQHEKSAEIGELYSKGITSPTEISKALGIPEGTVRSYIKQMGSTTRLQKTEEVKNTLKELVAEDKYVDVGAGTEYALGVSATKKDYIVSELQKEGYSKLYYYSPQISNPGKNTTIEVLAPPGTTTEQMTSDLKSGLYSINPVDRFIVNPDGSTSILNLPPVNSVDSKRIFIRYAEDGGLEKDGIIELRRDVDDISLGNARYAQVRIGVDGKLYLKGMAIYSDDVPEGKDIIFNTNKSKGTPMEKVFKEMKLNKMTGEVDADNPFGASIKPEKDLVLAQRYYIDKNTGEKKVSAINIVNEEGDWTKWSRNTPSQFLSKQPEPLIKQQLNLSYLKKLDEYNDIKSISNESVRRVMLQDFFESCDTAAVELKGAALPRQQTHVLLPIPSLKEKEIYAPNYATGEEVVLVRFPHAGTFEIPRLTVNNNNKEGKRIIGNAPDAVGITGATAAQLSGADFDGDTAMVIPYRTSTNPNSKYNNIRTDKALAELQEFDPKREYKAYEGMTEVKKDRSWDKQKQMGSVSNLITDMTLKGAPTRDIIKAVRHSMVIIDAEKHNLDWRRSEVDNDIKTLKKTWQGKERGGASTIISRASAETYKDEERLTFRVDSDTGEKITFKTGATKKERKPVGFDEEGNRIYQDTGNYIPKTQKSTRMADVKDAYELLSDNPTRKEILYANYANQMKSLANSARLEWSKTPTGKRDRDASQLYSKEVDELDDLIVKIGQNRPRERQAQLRATNSFYKKKKERDDLNKDDLKKLRNQCLAEAREACGAKAQRISLTPKQWEAIENHAVSGTKAETIIRKCNKNDIMKYALPKEGNKLSTSKVRLIKAYDAQGQSTQEIADALGVSTSTVQKYLTPGT